MLCSKVSAVLTDIIGSGVAKRMWGGSGEPSQGPLIPEGHDFLAALLTGTVEMSVCYVTVPILLFSHNDIAVFGKAVNGGDSLHDRSQREY